MPRIFAFLTASLVCLLQPGLLFGADLVPPPSTTLVDDDKIADQTLNYCPDYVKTSLVTPMQATSKLFGSLPDGLRRYALHTAKQESSHSELD